MVTHGRSRVMIAEPHSIGKVCAATFFGNQVASNVVRRHRPTTVPTSTAVPPAAPVRTSSRTPCACATAATPATPATSHRVAPPFHSARPSALQAPRLRRHPAGSARRSPCTARLRPRPACSTAPRSPRPTAAAPHRSTRPAAVRQPSFRQPSFRQPSLVFHGLCTCLQLPRHSST